jgi:hypothetical protein
MRIWNLSELSDLNQTVVDDSPAVTLGRKYGLKKPALDLKPFKVLAGVASVAVSLSFGIATVNSSTVRLPNWSAAVVRTAPNLKPPLENMFIGRFDSEWTEANEHSLVNQIAENRLARKALDPPADLALFIFSNQQEDVSLESPRLSLTAIQQLVRKRKSS